MIKILAAIWRYVFSKPEKPPTIWYIDRDGRVRTDKDRPVVLRAREPA